MKPASRTRRQYVGPRRDEFPEAVKRALRDRVGGVCSNPDCETHTVGPDSSADKVLLLGHACHISAASKNGPRYDPALTTAERKRYDNGIWLCGVCSTRVDRDCSAYPPEVLRKWKADAEARAKERLNKRMPGERQATDLLTTALSGASTDLSVSALTNVHHAVEAGLQRRDPRFVITSTRDQDGVRLLLQPKEEVRIAVHVPSERISGFAEALQSLQEHGTPAVLPLKGLRFSGSPIFEDLHPKLAYGGLLTLEPRPRSATLLVERLDDRDCSVASAQAEGCLRVGSSTCSFSGKAFGGLINFALTLPINGASGSHDLSFTIDLSQWEGADVSVLRHFDRMYAFLFQAVEGRAFSVTLEADGLRLIRGRGPVNQTLADEAVRGHLHYLWALRVLADCLSFAVRYLPNEVVAPEHVIAVIQTAEVVATMNQFGALPDVDEAAATLQLGIPGAELVEQLRNGTVAVRYVHEPPAGTRAFGQLLPAWQSVIEIDEARLESPEDLASKQVGDSVDVTFRVAQTGTCRVRVERAPAIVGADG